MKIAIIGAGGRVGLPLSILCADAGHNVTGFDINQDVVSKLNKGDMPFFEEDAAPLLIKNINQTLNFTTDSIVERVTEKYDMFIYILGTPVDSESNPVLDDIIAEFRVLKKYIDSIQETDVDYRPTIILRSTVAPGTTRTLDFILSGKRDNPFPNYELFYIPERVLQGKSMSETIQHDWIIGGIKETPRLIQFMKSLGIEHYHFFDKWESAEVGKLMTNMYRYMNFAFANEMYLIGEHYGIDTHKMINAFNSNYPRLNVPAPGPNVGGPCLFKDGKFLTQHIPYSDLIDVSFRINEGMPEYIANKLVEIHTNKAAPLENVLILGGTFKANCDDIRNSLSFKLVKCLKRRGIQSFIQDPYFDYTKYIKDTKNIDIVETGNYDAVVIMTPHDEFDNEYVRNVTSKCNQFGTLCDIWKKTDVAKSKGSMIFDDWKVMI